MVATKLDEFTRTYLEAALWSSTDDDGEPLDGLYTADDLAADCVRQAVEDCTAFQADNADDLAGIDAGQAGHDFWLTRNRHGAGYWDRGLGAVGTRLTDAAHVYGSCDLYVGDDGQIYS